MKEISVIIPAYNAEKYMLECLESIYNQTFKDYEILVINDASTDKTEKIVNDFVCIHTDFDLRLITIPSGGAARARNAGIRLAKGKYIAFIDADDTIENSMFQKMVDVAEKVDADLVTCDFFWCYPDKNKRHKLLPCRTNRELFGAAWAAPWNKIYRKSMLVDNNIYFTEGYTFEDTSFYLKYIPFCKTVNHIEEPLLYWRQHNNSTMRGSQNDRIKQIFPVLSDAIEFYKGNGNYDSYKDDLEFFCVKLLWGSSMYRICQVRNRAERDEDICMTLDWLEEYFPNWKNNIRFQTGIRGWYIRSINRYTAEIYANLIYYFRYFGRNKM